MPGGRTNDKQHRQRRGTLGSTLILTRLFFLSAVARQGFKDIYSFSPLWGMQELRRKLFGAKKAACVSSILDHDLAGGLSSTSILLTPVWQDRLSTVLTPLGGLHVLAAGWLKLEHSSRRQVTVYVGHTSVTSVRCDLVHGASVSGKMCHVLEHSLQLYWCMGRS